MSDLLFEIPQNPVPENTAAGMLTSFDGTQIRYALFPATGRPLRGTVIILQGRNECIEKYFETVRDLSARGFGSAMIDLRGQGGSDRLIDDPARGYVEDFSDYVRDIDVFFENVVLPDCRGPFYLLAHSTGALIALLAAPALVNRVRRMVLSAPFFELTGTFVSAGAMRFLTNALYALGLGKTYIGGGPPKPDPTPFATNVLTSDHDRYARNTALYRRYPKLRLGGPTVSWLKAAYRAIDTVMDEDFAPALSIPTLLVAAGADEVVSKAAIEAFSTRLRAGSLLTIDGARHEILQEADIYREQFFAAFDSFVPGSETEAV